MFKNKNACLLGNLNKNKTCIYIKQKKQGNSNIK